MPFRIALFSCLLTLVLAAGCRRQPAISDDAYRQVVTAFYTSLAAMQTSQDVLAREQAERAIQLAPHEPAPLANLGLLLLRQQQLDEAIQRLQAAASLAPDNAAIVRLVALAESQRGDTQASIAAWRKAMALDPADPKAPYALALELERQAAGGDAEAQQVLEALAARTGNLAVQLELARIAARRGDAPTLQKAIGLLAQQSQSWPAEARERLQAVRDAAGRGAAEAATPVIFLKNVLIPTPEYRAALAEVTTPRSEIGEPLTRFVVLPNPAPRPAAADDRLAFSIDPQPPLPAPDSTWVGAVWLTGDGAPVVAAADERTVRLSTGATFPFPGGANGTPPGRFGVAAGDLNYDFRTDIALAGSGGVRIYRQDEKGGFADVTKATGLPADVVSAPMSGIWSADIDTDGDLDLLAARNEGAPAVLRNNGDGTFAVLPVFANVSRVRGFVWADLDGEGVPDALLLDAQGAVRAFQNLRGGVFRERTLPSAFTGIVDMAAAELTGDAVLDAVGVTAAGALVRLTYDETRDDWDASELARVELPAGFSADSGRLLLEDLDNNGATDIVVSSASASRVALRGPDSDVRPLGNALAIGALATADLDGNGRVELIGRGSSGPAVARSSGERSYHWQLIRPRAATATGDQRVNSFGIGGEVEIRTGVHAQRKVILAPVVHFGLGDATTAEVARIMWPNGVLQSEFELAADSAILATQRLKGSCPWLFAWDGRAMSFVTDFIWRSPLGLRINSQATADVLMTEDWVKIRGDQLAPRDGVYDLRITAELWETHFFDLISMLVVDHPAGTEVFVDERFAVPPPKFEVIATSPVKEFAAVRDDTGRDASAIVRARDDRHLDFAGRGAYQGVTREHYVEMELPDDAPRTGPLYLVAQGWVHPTDSSVNVALGQGSHAPPTGLSLHVADARGRFRMVRSGLGFPAGKDKTILINLKGLFPATGPRRMRLQTNLEIFWDRLGWAVGRPDVTLRTQRIPLSSAELVYRGYSVTNQPDTSTPERPQYVLAGTTPRWRDLEGFHTRFGDVRELLAGVDDRYVIMNAGDEIRMTFPEVPPPGDGWVRDFVLIGDGWVKDGDYNTVASRTVFPLPTHSTAAYDRGTGRLEDDPVYQRHKEDFARYHTRYVSPDSVRDALSSGTGPDDP